MSSEIQGYIVIPRLLVENWNIASAPFTWGVPAPSAFIGLQRALERRLPRENPIELMGTGYIVHDWDVYTHKDYLHSLRLMRFPVGKDGKTAGIVEEGRGRMTVSLILGFSSRDASWLTTEHPGLQETAAHLQQALYTMRIAGGTVWESPHLDRGLHAKAPYIIINHHDDEVDQKALRRFRRHMLPGSFLVSREDWLDERLRELRQDTPDATLLDAWLDSARRRWSWQEPQSEKEKGTWQHSRKRGSGWIVPIPVGYVGIDQAYGPGEVRQSRDPSVGFRFVEAAYSVGEWLGIHRLEQLSDLLWYPETDDEAGTYLCVNDYNPNNLEEN